MTYYYKPEEIERIKEIENTAIMTGHFGDGKNYENGMKVLDCVEEIMKMINAAQKKYDEEDERTEKSQPQDEAQDGDEADDTKPGQIKGSPRQGTGKDLYEIDTDLYSQIKSSV